MSKDNPVEYMFSLMICHIFLIESLSKVLNQGDILASADSFNEKSQKSGPGLGQL